MGVLRGVKTQSAVFGQLLLSLLEIRVAAALFSEPLAPLYANERVYRRLQIICAAPTSAVEFVSRVADQSNSRIYTHPKEIRNMDLEGC